MQAKGLEECTSGQATDKKDGNNCSVNRKIHVSVI
jgi:hypothetical protein